MPGFAQRTRSPCALTTVTSVLQLKLIATTAGTIDCMRCITPHTLHGYQLRNVQQMAQQGLVLLFRLGEASKA